jgi:hypothetical protein
MESDMPNFRQMTTVEVDTMLEKKTKDDAGQRKAIAAMYRETLQSYERGAWVEVTLDPDDKRDTVKLRLKRAATALGLHLDFKRTRGERLRFQIQ